MKPDSDPLEKFGRKCQFQQTVKCYYDFIKNSQLQRLFNQGC